MLTDSSDIVRGIAATLIVAREGSFRGAMRRTRSGFRTLERHVSALESRLGFPIFHRTGDGVVPTAEGRMILAEAHKIEQIVAGVLRLGQALNNETTGEVLLAATEGLGAFWITPQLEDFARRHPRVAIRINPSMTLADMTQFGTDLALQVVEPVVPDIRRLRLGRLHMMLAAAPAYLQRRGRPRSLADLRDHTFVVHSNPQTSDRRFIEEALGAPLDAAQFIVMRNSASHFLTLQQGHGIGFLPTYGFAIGAKLTPLSLPVRHSVDIWLCFHETSRAIPRVAAVIDWLSGIFDPRVFPWFRREFVHPREFAAIIRESGAATLVEKIALAR